MLGKEKEEQQRTHCHSDYDEEAAASSAPPCPTRQGGQLGEEVATTRRSRSMLSKVQLPTLESAKQTHDISAASQRHRDTELQQSLTGSQ